MLSGDGVLSVLCGRRWRDPVGIAPAALLLSFFLSLLVDWLIDWFRFYVCLLCCRRRGARTRESEKVGLLWGGKGEEQASRGAAVGARRKK